MEHKDIVFPDVDISGDEGEPGWEKGEFQPSGEYRKYVRQPRQYTKHWQHIRERWQEAVTEYENNPDDFFNSWYYLSGHPMYWYFLEGGSKGPANHVWRLNEAWGENWIDIQPHRYEDGRVVIWLETGKLTMLPPEEKGARPHPTTWHDYELDTEAPTYEEAIIKLARAVHDRYGNDRRICDKDEP